MVKIRQWITWRQHSVVVLCRHEKFTNFNEFLKSQQLVIFFYEFSKHKLRILVLCRRWLMPKLENLLDRRGWEWCLRQASKSSYGFVWTWSFHLLVPWTPCANLQQNQFIRFQTNVFGKQFHENLLRRNLTIWYLIYSAGMPRSRMAERADIYHLDWWRQKKHQEVRCETHLDVSNGSKSS